MDWRKHTTRGVSHQTPGAEGIEGTPHSTKDQLPTSLSNPCLPATSMATTLPQPNTAHTPSAPINEGKRYRARKGRSIPRHATTAMPRAQLMRLAKVPLSPSISRSCGGERCGRPPSCAANAAGPAFQTRAHIFLWSKSLIRFSRSPTRNKDTSTPASQDTHKPGTLTHGCTRRCLPTRNRATGMRPATRRTRLSQKKKIFLSPIPGKHISSKVMEHPSCTFRVAPCRRRLPSSLACTTSASVSLSTHATWCVALLPRRYSAVIGGTDMPGPLRTGPGSETPPSKRVRREGDEATTSPSSSSAAAGASTHTMER